MKKASFLLSALSAVNAAGAVVYYGHRDGLLLGIYRSPFFAGMTVFFALLAIRELINERPR
jgi:hypothetical protein